MDDSIRLCITTPDGTVYDGMVSYVNLPAAGGSLGVLKNHAPMLCALQQGTIRCKAGGKEFGISVSDGIANVIHNAITVLVSRAETIS